MAITLPVTHISLCTGYGGIDLGLRRAIPNLRTIAYSEIEAFACANLVAKMEAGLLDSAPIWTDLKTFPWESFSGLVDILSGGYPCQPFSAAGKRAGKDDPRHLWPWIADGIRLLRPGICFFENVEGHITLGLSTVVSDLEEMGYRVSWGIFSASEVGAPHQRKRVFILAHNFSERIKELQWVISVEPQQHSLGNCGFGWRKVSFAAECEGEDGEQCSVCGGDYSECGCPGPTQDGYEYAEFGGTLFARPEQQWPGRPGEPQHEWEPPRTVEDAQQLGRGRRDYGNAAGVRREIQTQGSCGGGGEAGAMGNTTSPRCPRAENTRTDRGDESQGTWREESERNGDMANNEQCGSDGRRNGTCGRIGESKEVEADAIAGGSEGHVLWQAQPPLGGDADGSAGGLDYAGLCIACDNRTDELRLLGNGVVPLTAEKAFLTLIKQEIQH